jgi:hypothetical protein
MHRAGPHLDIERLLQEAAARRPEFRQFEDQLLQRDQSSVPQGHGNGKWKMENGKEIG